MSIQHSQASEANYDEVIIIESYNGQKWLHCTKLALVNREASEIADTTKSVCCHACFPSISLNKGGSLPTRNLWGGLRLLSWWRTRSNWSNFLNESSRTITSEPSLCIMWWAKGTLMNFFNYYVAWNLTYQFGDPHRQLCTVFQLLF